jgi:hypothetical protein
MTQEHDTSPEVIRQATIRRRNRAMALTLGFLVVLFFAITVVKMAH